VHCAPQRDPPVLDRLDHHLRADLEEGGGSKKSEADLRKERARENGSERHEFGRRPFCVEA
jgi:hypothetical protein